MTLRTATTHPADLSDQPAGRAIPRDEDAALYEAEVGHLTGLSVRTIQALRLKGGGPRFFLAGNRRAVRYRRRDVMAWVEARMQRSTSDPGPAETPAGNSRTTG